MNEISAAGFRSQFKGYNREDVNAFIRDTDERNAEERNALREKLKAAEETAARLKEDNGTLTARVAELVQKVQRAEEAAQAERTAAKSLSEELETIRSRVSELETENLSASDAQNVLRTDLEEADRQRTALASANETLRKKITALGLNPDDDLSRPEIGDIDNHDSPLYKLRMYERISGQLGDIMINANRNAAQILNDAKQEVEMLRRDTDEFCEKKRRDCDNEVQKIRQETAEEAVYIRDRLSDTASRLLSGVSSDIHSSADGCMREVQSCLSDMRYEIDALLSKLRNRAEDMNDRVNFFTSSASDDIAAKLGDLENKYGIFSPGEKPDGQNTES